MLQHTTESDTPVMEFVRRYLNTKVGGNFQVQFGIGNDGAAVECGRQLRSNDALSRNAVVRPSK
jgi:hypothetical protein